MKLKVYKAFSYYQNSLTGGNSEDVLVVFFPFVYSISFPLSSVLQDVFHKLFTLPWRIGS